MRLAREELKRLNPDVFVATEVRDWAAFDELISVLPKLNTHVVSSFVDPETGEIRPQQIGIASKLTCRAASWEPWKANVPNTPRGFSFAALETPEGQLLMVYGNHFKSNRGAGDEIAREVAAMRNDQAKQLIEHRAVVEKSFFGRKISGWIAAGDFNTNHDGQFPLCNAIKLLTDAGYHNTWADVPKSERLTWQAKEGSPFQSTTFDYFFTLGLGNPKAVEIKTPVEISDHRAIGLIVNSAP